MAAVLPRSATDIRLFHPELIASPRAAQPTFVPKFLERYHSVPFVMYDPSGSPHLAGPNPNLNGISQPGTPSSPESESRLSTAPMYSRPPPHLREGTSLGHLSSPLVPRSGMLSVLDYTPSEGEENVPVTVTVDLRTDNDVDAFGHNMPPTSLRLRLIFGGTAVRTMVKHLPAPPRMHEVNGKPQETNPLRLRLQASAPPHVETRWNDSRVPISVQAMDGDTNIVETYTFGTFTYWAPATIRPTAVVDMHKLTAPLSPAQNKRKREEDNVEVHSVFPKSESPSEFDSSKKIGILPLHTDRGYKLVRTTNIPGDLPNSSDVQQAELEWVAGTGTQHPSSLDKKWSSHELETGRRLIRFRRELSGNKLRVSCEVIPQEAYDTDDIVISCVYRQETRNCWFTSVDIIYLLERLVGGPFSVEEKNRIRRNLEGFKPTTVSKTKGGFELFFQRIMDFPPPKPRNIEKDVKVFAWTLLVPALEKIISKYSVIPVSDSESSCASQESSSSSSAEQQPRAKKVGRSRSSSNSQTTSDEVSLTRPVKSEQPFHSLHMVAESPQILHPDTPHDIPERNPMQAPVIDYGFPPLSLPEEDPWRGHEQTSVLGAMDPHVSGFYLNQDSSGTHNMSEHLRAEAFSNPFASDVNFGALGSHGQLGHGFESAADMHGGTNPGSRSRAAQFEANLNEDVFDSRRSSLASELLYPMSGSSPNGNHDFIAATYGSGAQDANEVHHDFLYPHFHTGTHHLPLEDGNAQ